MEFYFPVELLDALNESIKQLKEGFSEIKLLPYMDGDLYTKISFKLNGVLFSGELKGRNRDLLIGFGDDQDKQLLVGFI